MDGTSWEVLGFEGSSQKGLSVMFNSPKLFSKCCADSNPGLKLITVNKWKLNNKHTQRTQEFVWFSKLPTSMATTEKFHYKKFRRYNSAQEHSQKTQIPITPYTFSQENTRLNNPQLFL